MNHVRIMLVVSSLCGFASSLYAPTSDGEKKINHLNNLSELLNFPIENIEIACLERLDDIYQDYLCTFKKKLWEERADVIFGLTENGLEAYNIQAKELKILEKMPPEQYAPFYLLACLYQFKTEEEKRTEPDKKNCFKKFLKLIRSKV